MQDWREEYILYSRLPVFKRRVNDSAEIIEQALAKDVKWYIACSFGKDSICLLDLAIKIKPDLPVLHMDSGYCFPETYETRDYYMKQYNLNLTVLPATIDYFELMHQFGMPGISRTKSQQIKVVKMIKKDHPAEWAKKHGLSGVFMGLRKDESNGRRYTLNIRSPIYQTGDGMWKCCPLANWTIKDVWAYIITNNLKYPAFYDYTGIPGYDREWIRNSSWCTTDGAERGKIVWLRKYYPELYRRLIKEFPITKNYV